jgi:hypothetical protein
VIRRKPRAPVEVLISPWYLDFRAFVVSLYS